MTSVKITSRRIVAEKVPRGERPVYEIELEDHEQIVGVEFEFEHDYPRRKTVDHFLTVYVAARPGAAAQEG